MLAVLLRMVFPHSDKINTMRSWLGSKTSYGDGVPREVVLRNRRGVRAHRTQLWSRTGVTAGIL